MERTLPSVVVQGALERGAALLPVLVSGSALALSEAAPSVMRMREERERQKEARLEKARRREAEIRRREAEELQRQATFQPQSLPTQVFGSD
jgi:hypothetical protein